MGCETGLKALVKFLMSGIREGLCFFFVLLGWVILEGNRVF
jgi:hypothetical protein